MNTFKLDCIQLLPQQALPVALQIWTLPGLEPVKVFSLSSCLGFPWSWQSEPSLLTNLHHLCCLAHDGHMALVGPCNEVITLGVLRGLHPPPPVRGLYDQDLSEASLAAAGAMADLQEKREPWSGVTPRDTAAGTAGGLSPISGALVVLVYEASSQVLALPLTWAVIGVVLHRGMYTARAAALSCVKGLLHFLVSRGCGP